MLELPIDGQLPHILALLQSHNCLIVEAPPGTGKTTRAAPALLPLAAADPKSKDPARTDPTLTHHSDFPQGKVLLIQPRRIAARAAATRIAAELRTPLGQLVGYQVRFDARVSAASRLIAMTPGILLRRLQSDSVLADVAAVVLDEFHERSLEVDLLLGMLRRLQQELRPELRLMLMSATLDSRLVQSYLDHPPVVSVTARTFPVQKHFSRFQPTSTRGHSSSSHSRSSPSRRIVEQCVSTTRQAANSHPGDILVFLPGVGEIHQVARELMFDADREGWQLLKLYGDLPSEDQDRVLAPTRQRKVILSTNVAETSLTIENVRIVVDSGWARVQRFDPAVGLNMLVLEPIPNASAEQRAGRAGRTDAGVCYRLWDEITGRSRPAFLEPEVLRVDLTGAVLQLLCWGEADVANFPWLTPPSPQALEQALQTLHLLDAVDEKGQVTRFGRRMNELPVQPRLASLLLAGQAAGVTHSAALAAACLSERDIFDRRATRPPDGAAIVECDVTRQVIALQRFSQGRAADAGGEPIKAGAAQHVLRVARQLQSLLGSTAADERADKRADEHDPDQLLRQALLVAFPDRLALRRTAGQPRGLMVAGRGVKLDDASSVHKSELFLCLDVDAGGSEARVRKASAVEAQWLPAHLLTQRDERFFHPTAEAVVTRRRNFFLDLMLSETPIETPADQATAELLAKEAAERFERLLPPKDKALHSWLARVRWLANELPSAPLPSLATENLAKLISGWCFGLRKLDELKQLPWQALLQAELSPAGRKLLATQAPEDIKLPTGRVVLLQYETGKPPVLAARIQEFFGWSQTPRLAEGRAPLLLHLLAPNGRVQQITDDLASFWSTTYPVVRKELRGRYPKHAWPENPLAQ